MELTIFIPAFLANSSSKLSTSSRSEFAFIFKKKTTSVQFLKDEITCYIRFHTKRPIILKQFFWDKRINDYYHPLMASKHHKYSHGPVSKILPFYYKLFDKFQFKKKLIKIIENNLVKE